MTSRSGRPGAELGGFTDEVIRRLEEGGFIDADDPEGLAGDLLRIACGWADDPEAANQQEPSDADYVRRLRELLDELSINADGRWTAQVILGDLARDGLRQRLSDHS